jgi:arabinan endo-1,5-alpha-L-arabinosidase
MAIPPCSEDAWYLVVTSNDAPDSFPILRTSDLATWELAGFVFPAGNKPTWAREGAGYSDYWAPELHRVGNEYLVCFAARGHDGSPSIGIARATSPAGPFTTPPQPLLRGGVIDAHIFVGAGEHPLLLWKQDSNEIWPRMLAQVIAEDRSLAQRLFATPDDQRTAAVSGALWSWGVDLSPMEQFFLLQPLIEAVIDNFADVRARLTVLGTPEALLALEAMRTPIYAQRLLPDGSALVGERTTVLVNDLDWEAHLIEGPWLTEKDGRFYLFYSGNDFSTREYGIGVAIADDPLGPYRKVERPLLRSTTSHLGTEVSRIVCCIR